MTTGFTEYLHRIGPASVEDSDSIIEYPQGGQMVFAQSVLGIGTDIVEVDRVEATLRRFGPRFERRVFSPAEMAYARGGQTGQRLAARFAAKEAVLKALGVGLAGGALRDVEIVRGERGAPAAVLTGRAAERAARMGVDRVLVSLSHSRRYAVAQAVAIGDGRLEG